MKIGFCGTMSVGKTTLVNALKETKEFKNYVTFIRNIEMALGKSKKIPTKSELKNLKLVRKSIVAKKDITKGDIFNFNNIIAKRPAGGISPMKINTIIGKKAKKNFKIDEKISI